MVSEINTVTFNGINTVDVNVQVSISPGLPAFNIVGLPDKTIAESKERIRAALNSIALAMPPKRVVINLAPADLMKEGSHFDLPIMIGILVGLNVIPAEAVENFIVIGELGLNSQILPVNGILPAAIKAATKNMGIICPQENGSEALWSGNDSIIAAPHLLSLINHFKGTSYIAAPSPVELPQEVSLNKHLDFKDVIGQETTKRILEISAAGNHNVLMIGSPGAGKSMLAARMPSILPPMSPEEILETSMIYSVMGEIKNGQLNYTRPFRAPHHSASQVAIVGGGHSKRIMPGEISLAHNGILFLDELPEFSRAIIDSLRQPLETKEISISRAGSFVKYPANFQLIAAMNPCRCGYLNQPNQQCSKAPKCGEEYQNKISGPIIDRFDLFVEVHTVPEYEHSLVEKNETSEEIKQRVIKARIFQKERFEKASYKTNASLDGDLLYSNTKIDDDSKNLLNSFAKKMSISMRSYNRILKVSRTIADLEQKDNIEKHHISEAISYRFY
ncbi:MAG: YifB family Mg chelatase-like AAA ATPase [Rickettsiales bacterium]|nr:YifB family Mg chelatase-like AAA ATPase [Rickettsiales bacterium]